MINPKFEIVTMKGGGCNSGGAHRRLLRHSNVLIFGLVGGYMDASLIFSSSCTYAFLFCIYTNILQFV